jgi:hypothetical protein
MAVGEKLVAAEPDWLQPRISDRKEGPYSVVGVSLDRQTGELVREPWNFVVADPEKGFVQAMAASERTARLWAACYSRSNPESFEVTSKDGTVIAVFRQGRHIL